MVIIYCFVSHFWQALRSFFTTLLGIKLCHYSLRNVKYQVSHPKVRSYAESQRSLPMPKASSLWDLGQPARKAVNPGALVRSPYQHSLLPLGEMRAIAPCVASFSPTCWLWDCPWSQLCISLSWHPPCPSPSSLSVFAEARLRSPFWAIGSNRPAPTRLDFFASLPSSNFHIQQQLLVTQLVQAWSLEAEKEDFIGFHSHLLMFPNQNMRNMYLCNNTLLKDSFVQGFKTRVLSRWRVLACSFLFRDEYRVSGGRQNC